MPGPLFARLPIPLRSALLIVLALAFSFAAMREAVIAHEANKRRHFARAFADSFEQLTRVSESNSLRMREIAQDPAVAASTFPQSPGPYAVTRSVLVAKHQSEVFDAHALEYTARAQQHRGEVARIRERGRLVLPEASAAFVLLVLALADAALRRNRSSSGKQQSNKVTTIHDC